MIPAIKNMTTDEKIALVEELWDEYEKERTNSLSNNQMMHIKNRIEEHNIQGNTGKGWEEIKLKYAKK